MSNAEMKGYLKIMALTNSAICNNTEAMIDSLVRRFNVPYQRAESIATNFRRDTRKAR
ncbi:MAG: hypothetical protein ACYTFW_00650 [Planctomycetota bacterium]